MSNSDQPPAVRQLAYRPLHAPRGDGEMLAEPPFDAVGAMVRENVQLRGRADYDFGGRSLAELSRQARAELLRDAIQWTSAYRDERGQAPSPLIFLAGHQPQLFHPGVWLKNFALGALARQHGAVPVNLVIDSDTAKSVALRVPGGSVSAPHATMIPYDAPAAAVPYEERAIVDRRLLDDFDRRVLKEMGPLAYEPLIKSYWPLVRERAEATGNLGACLAQSRHQLEGQWGLQTLEVPQSRVCDGEAFRWFAGHILAELPRFHAVYNAALAEYRRVHGIRNAAQPVPDLATDGPWLEAPFWVWSAKDPQRRHLFARREGERIVLRAATGTSCGAGVSPAGAAGTAAPQGGSDGHGGGQSHFRWGENWDSPLGENWDSPPKIRSRALITTLWARLVLGDLFLHGIGGAKYDQLTDLLIERFFGLAPPGFMVLSATLLLPIGRTGTGPRPELASGASADTDAGRGPVPVLSAAEQARAGAQRLRDVVYHPERILASPGRQPGDSDDVSHAAHSRADTRGSPADLQALLAEKARWIAAPQTPDNARTRCRAIRDINARLQPWVADERARLLRLQDETARALQAEAILAWREYGFCLYPEKILRNNFAALLPKSA